MLENQSNPVQCFLSTAIESYKQIQSNFSPPGMNRRNAYSVPDLSTKEIVSYLADLNIIISAADILKPSVAMTSAVYDSLLEAFEGKGVQDCEEPLQVVRQVQRMGNLLERVGITNFTIRDLNPDSRRFIQILSMLINFSMYRDNKKQIYEQVSKFADDSFAERKRLEMQLESMRKDIETVQKDLERHSTMKENLESEVVSLENELKEFYKYQKEKMSEVNRLKNEKIEIGDKLCSSQLLEHNLKQEITCLRAQIVSDPSKLLELVEEMRSLIEKEREAIRKAERSIKEQGQLQDGQERLKGQIKRFYSVINELNEIEDKISKLDQSIVMSEGMLKNWDSSMNALKIRITHVERQVSHIESKIGNLQGRDKKVSEEITVKIANLRTKYDVVNNEREQLLCKMRENNKQVQDLMFIKAKKNGEHERECAEIASLLVHLNGEIETFFNNIKNTISQ